MDQAAQNIQAQNTPQPVESIPSSKTQSSKKIIGIIAIVSVVLLFISIGVVLLKRFPTEIKQSPIVPIPTPTPIALPCPSIASFCSNPQEVIKNGKSIGIGNTLPKNTPVYAIFDGTITIRTLSFASEKGGATFYNVRLTHNTLPINAQYLLGKQIPGKSSAKKGDIIGYTTEGIEYYDGYSLVFSLLDDTGRVLKEHMIFQ